MMARVRTDRAEDSLVLPPCRVYSAQAIGAIGSSQCVVPLSPGMFLEIAAGTNTVRDRTADGPHPVLQ
jgi:hypothetical protein